MKCDKIKELLLTDHADGELSPEMMEQVEAHLLTCPACMELRGTLLLNVLDPLRNAEELTPPESLWQKIRTSIEPAEERQSVIDLLRDIFVVKHPLVALATVASLLVAGIFFTRNFVEHRDLNYYMAEQVDFLISLGNGNGSEYADIGIPNEEFFL